VAIAFVDAERMAQLNREHPARRAHRLSFPIDEDRPIGAAPRELGDVVICPEYTDDVPEAVIHGVLHLVGMDHERDEGEMLALQRELRSWL
jgi:probable rRNA maturation factor